jgi:hypothetical protein
MYTDLEFCLEVPQIEAAGIVENVVRSILAKWLRPIHTEFASLRAAIAKRSGSTSRTDRYRQEIDHALECIAVIAKHLGNDAQPSTPPGATPDRQHRQQMSALLR